MGSPGLENPSVYSFVVLLHLVIVWTELQKQNDRPVGKIDLIDL